MFQKVVHQTQSIEKSRAARAVEERDPPTGVIIINNISNKTKLLVIKLN